MERVILSVREENEVSIQHWDHKGFDIPSPKQKQAQPLFFFLKTMGLMFVQR